MKIFIPMKFNQTATAGHQAIKVKKLSLVAGYVSSKVFEAEEWTSSSFRIYMSVFRVVWLSCTLQDFTHHCFPDILVNNNI